MACCCCQSGGKAAKTHHSEHLIKAKDGTEHFMRTLRAASTKSDSNNCSCVRDLANAAKWRGERHEGEPDDMEAVCTTTQYETSSLSSQLKHWRGGGGKGKTISSMCLQYFAVNDDVHVFHSFRPIFCPSSFPFSQLRVKKNHYWHLLNPSTLSSLWRSFSPLQAKQFSISNPRHFRLIYHLSRSENNLEAKFYGFPALQPPALSVSAR